MSSIGVEVGQYIRWWDIIHYPKCGCQWVMCKTTPQDSQVNGIMFRLESKCDDCREQEESRVR